VAIGELEPSGAVSWSSAFATAIALNPEVNSGASDPFPFAIFRRRIAVALGELQVGSPATSAAAAAAPRSRRIAALRAQSAVAAGELHAAAGLAASLRAVALATALDATGTTLSEGMLRDGCGERRPKMGEGTSSIELVISPEMVSKSWWSDIPIAGGDDPSSRTRKMPSSVD
tara:strand:+ start:1580 stop:2098 length:519 start_codon:yes stop_codon:yes gene_type:complete